MASAHRGAKGKGGRRAEAANDTSVVAAAEEAVAARAAVAAAEDDEALRAQRQRKAAIRAKGLSSLPGAKKGGEGSAGASGETTPISPDDPLYDRRMDGGGDAEASRKASEALLEAEADRAELMQLAAFKSRVSDILAEFFVSQDFAEAIRSFGELSPPSLRPEIAKRVLLLSLDRSDTDRELASRLLSECYGEVLTMMHIGKGFTMLFAVGSELEKDSPDAVPTLARFLARAVVDEILPPAFLMDPGVEEAGGPVVAEARVLLSAPHAAARLEHVWGAAAAAGVAELKEQVRMAAQELFDAGSLSELERCVKDLGAPAFHHEVVKRLVVVAVGRGERERTLATDALAHLGPGGVGVISESQAERGLRRVVAELPDLKLDTPAAETYVRDMIAAVRGFGVIGEDAELTAAAGAAVAGEAAAAEA